METVAIAGAKGATELDMNALAKQRAAIEAVFDAQEDAFYTSGRLLDHGIIDRATRAIYWLSARQYERKIVTCNPTPLASGACSDKIGTEDDMQKPDTQTVLLEEDRDWATLRLNRPDARNALSDELVADLTALLDYLAQRDDIRGITVRGNGDAFCAGGDLKGFKNNFQFP